MSYWGLTVISNVLATVPVIGIYLCNWIWGSEFINDYTLVKIHSIHIFLPFLLGFVVIAHFFALHYFLSSDGLMDRFAFYYERYFFFMLYYLRDLYLVLNMFFLFTYFICIYWYFVFHEESWEIVNILKTSDKILPDIWAFSGIAPLLIVRWVVVFLGVLDFLEGILRARGGFLLVFCKE